MENILVKPHVKSAAKLKGILQGHGTMSYHLEKGILWGNNQGSNCEESGKGSDKLEEIFVPEDL